MFPAAAFSKCDCGGTCGGCGRRAMHGLRGLGATSQLPASEASAVAQLPGALGQANALMNQLYQMNADNPGVLSGDTLARMAELQGWLSASERAYWSLYAQFVGAPPTMAGLHGLKRYREQQALRGLSSLGALYSWPWPLTGLISFGVILAAAGLIYKYLTVLKAQADSELTQAQANVQQQTNIQADQANLAQAQADGDPVAAAQWAAALQANTSYQSGAPSGGSWLSNNWPYLAAGVVGLLVIREL